MEQEYTLKQYCIYILRKWFVILGTAIVGIALGIMLGYSSAPDYTVEVYESFITFDYEKYVDYKTDGAGIKTEGEQTIYSNTVATMASAVTDPSLESSVYNEVKDGYKNTKEKTDKKIADEFFANLNAKAEGYQTTVRFAYRIKNDDDRAYAQSVIDAYRTKAIERVVSRYDIDVNSPYANFYSSCDAHVNHNTADLEWVEKVSGESSIATDAIIGALVGAVVGVLAVLGIYLFDKKIKSVRVIAPEGYATVLYASKTALSKDATVKLASKIVSGGHKKVLVTTVSEKDTAKELEVLLKEKLNELGVTDVEVCSYDNACKGDLTLACKDFGAVCVAVCHKDASAKQFVIAMEEIKETGAQYLGAVLYDTDASYLD